MRTAIAALPALLFALCAGSLPAAAGDEHQHHHHAGHDHASHDHAGHQAPAWDARWEAAALDIPDLPVVSQDGRRLRFASDLVKGKTVAVNFIYTSCTTVCSPLTANFRQVQARLGDRVGKDVHMISVSVDPVVDTPARLKAFAGAFDAGPGWTFVTGAKADIERLMQAFGLPLGRKENHTPMIVVGNEPAGKWTRTWGLAPAEAIAGTIAETLAQSGEDHSRHHHGVAPQHRDQGAAAYFPDLPLQTHDGRTVRFYSDLLKGRTALINFMFTRCTEICPPMTANLAKVQAQLGDRLGRDIIMLSLTVDPAADSPAVLREYAGRFQAAPGWYFLTGRKADLDQVLAKLGALVADKNSHSTVLIAGNEASGEWMKLYAMADAGAIAEEVRRLAPGRAM